MPITPVPRLTDVPEFPALSDRAAGSYNSKAYAFGTHMSGPFNGEIQAVADSAFENASWSQLKAEAAAASASMAAAAVEAMEYTTGLAAFVSGKVYQQFEATISRVNAQVYRRTVAGSGTVDPANDTTGTWVIKVGSGPFIPQEVTGNSIDLSRGSDFFLTLNGSRTLTIDRCPAPGFSLALEVVKLSGTLILPSTVLAPNNVAYNFANGKKHLIFLRTRNQGAGWLMTAVPGYDNV